LTKIVLQSLQVCKENQLTHKLHEVQSFITYYSQLDEMLPKYNKQ